MPDSGWLKILKGSGPGFFLLLGTAIAAVALVWRLFPHTFSPPFQGAQEWAEAIAIVAFVVGSILLLWRVSGHLKLLKPMIKRWRLSFRYGSLTEAQTALLISAYQSGSREFKLPYEQRNERFVEELVEWGFIQSAATGVYIYAPADWPFRMSIEAWAVIKSKLRTSAKPIEKS